MHCKKKLKLNKVCVGTWLNSCSRIVAELLGTYPFDFICIDGEHSPVDVEQIHSLSLSIKSANETKDVFLRLPGVDYSQIKRYLDAGITGLICPMVESREQVSKIVDEMMYSPLGKRGLGFCSANQYGKKIVERYTDTNDQLLLAIQIETKKGCENIESILDNKFIDAVFIGPFDLSASLNIPGEFDNPVYLEHVKRVVNATKSKGIPCGIHLIKPCLNELDRHISSGYKLIAYSLDITMISNTCDELFSKRNL